MKEYQIDGRSIIRKQQLKEVWRNTHKDYKSVNNGIKSIMVYRNGTTLVALDDLTQEEINSRILKRGVDKQS